MDSRTDLFIPFAIVLFKCVIFCADKMLQPAVSDLFAPGTYIRVGDVEHVHALSTLTPVKVYMC